MSDLPPPQPAAPTPQPEKSSFLKRRFLKVPVWGWGVAVVAIVAIGAIGGGASDENVADDTTADTEAPAIDDTTAETQPSETVPADTAAPATEPPSTEPPATEPPTTPAPTLPGFDEGILLVGSDIQPGTYVAVVPDSSFNCYWARLSDVSGSFEGIIANDNTNPGAQALVSIAPTDVAFESNGCGRWTAFFPPAQPLATFGDGTWAVGAQVPAGRWRSSGPEPGDFNCYWQRSSGFGGTFDEIIANDNQQGPTIVDISPSDVGFTSKGCGTWTLAG
jgi:hypothetical protein